MVTGKNLWWRLKSWEREDKVKIGPFWNQRGWKFKGIILEEPCLWEAEKLSYLLWVRVTLKVVKFWNSNCVPIVLFFLLLFSSLWSLVVLSLPNLHLPVALLLLRHHSQLRDISPFKGIFRCYFEYCFVLCWQMYLMSAKGQQNKDSDVIGIILRVEDTFVHVKSDLCSLYFSKGW